MVQSKQHKLMIIKLGQDLATIELLDTLEKKKTKFLIRSKCLNNGSVRVCVFK